MPRMCYVIMPFSATESCTEEEWTQIYEDLFKPAVEEAGLEYQCRRSTATRGNIVAAILQNLNDSYVVLGDLTDRNANVFYELGVRHSLKDRTILVAQKREDIPFDLQAYAYHIYDWKTKEGRQGLIEKIRQLLAEIDSNPERPDNPVTDFLRRSPQAKALFEPVAVTPSETIVAKPLAGPQADGLNAIEFVRELVRRGQPQDGKTVLRLTKGELLPLMVNVIESMNKDEVPRSVPRAEIQNQAQEYISKLDPIVQKVEEFVLASIQEHWEPGIQLALRLSGDLISISEKVPGGQVIRYVQGAPALMAWRMLSLCGAKALDDEAFDFLGMVLREPIEVEESGGRFSNRSFIERRDLFYPEAFLGYADFPMKYIDGFRSTHPHLHAFFSTNDSYQLAIARFFIVVSLAALPEGVGEPLYPGYRFLRQSRRAMSQLCSRMSTSQAYLNGIAGAMGESGTHLVDTWSKRVQHINSFDRESQHRILYHFTEFPDPMNAEIS